MTLLVDTSVWSLAFRRDTSVHSPEINVLRDALAGSQPVVTTGLILQEILQGIKGPKAKDLIIERFRALPLIQPTRHDYIEAAEVRNTCRRNGVQIGTVDALLVQLCVGYDLTLLSCDRDFSNAAPFVSFKLWAA